MSNWLSVLKRPDNLCEEEGVENWFKQIASQLLLGPRLVVGGQPHRLVELEFYYCADGHPDAFALQAG